jgi:AraC-like DNA-binding protein/mannose-6-phosphate isomerase-like protein (cupin superfamily)
LTRSISQANFGIDRAKVVTQIQTKSGKHYDSIPRPVAVMSKAFQNGSSTGKHHHKCGQVLYANAGLMVAKTNIGTWAVPAGHALLIPPKLPHDIEMFGPVQMLTAYIAAEKTFPFTSGTCRVIRVSSLLKNLLETIVTEPLLYEPNSRGAHLAALIMDEVNIAKTTELELPMPIDRKLRAACQKIIDDPRLTWGITELADCIGVSRRTFTRRIREETGLSFGEWCRRWRNIRAMTLMANGVPAKLVASRVGYQSPQAMKAMIKRSSARSNFEHLE